MQIIYTARFLRSIKKLSVEIQDDAIVALEKFECKKNHRALKLHKLSGSMQKYHAFAINYHYRIVIKIEKGISYCMDISTHDVYR